MPTISRLDTVYRKMILTKFFTKGWGNPENLIRETCFNLVSKNHPITIVNEETWSDCRVIEGKFKSPLALHLPDVIPDEVHDAYFQMVLPLKWKSVKHKPVCVHLAGTGDHFYWRRRNIMAKPLLKAGIGAILLENPFYGLRKPKQQIRSCLHNVSDIFIMGGCLILECLVLLHWCEQNGYGPLGLSGLSMGGHMASLAATNWPKPVVLVPCLSWSTASSVFTEGVMSDSIDWSLLQEQYLNNSLYYDHMENLVTIIDKRDQEKLERFHQIFNTKPKEEKLEDTKTGVKQSGLLSPKIVKAILPKFISSSKSSEEKKLQKKAAKMVKKPENAVHFMRGIMDECTHLKNFSVPIDTSLIVAVCAQADGYVPREGCSSLEEVWPGATVHYLNAGHVSAYILYRKFFRKCIIEAFEKAKEKYVL